MDEKLIKVEHLVLSEGTGQRIDAYLSSVYPEIPRTLIKKYQDFLFLNGKKVKLSAKMKENDRILFSYKKEIEVKNLTQEEMDIPIVFEDDYLIVVNKPAGMVVHPAKGNWSGTLINGLYSHLNIEAQEGDLRPGIVHRLDKETSGLLLIAKDRETQEKLSQEFKERTIIKIYHALVWGFMRNSSGMIDLPIARHPKERKKFHVSELGKESLTEYKVLKEFEKTSFLEIRLHTGRTHQIRVHLAHLGHPVVGDKIYSRRAFQDPMCLNASRLEFLHPVTGKKVSFEVPLPEDFQKTMESKIKSS
ncbi:MAG: hypothetical protein A2Y41_13555 [Spirochaetes bacterium GWB1_36_13]|nr:MAG: hypothetical protein A2Y41_13555 [Spirochaetes bacterium GWB1_36_13]